MVTEETEYRYNDNDDNDNDNDDNDNHDNGAPEEGKIPLSDMIENVGDELRKAAQKDLQDLKRGEVPVMRFKECQIEVGVEVTGTVQAGITIWVFTLGATQNRTNTNTITVTFDRIAPESELAQVAQSNIGQQGG